MMAQTVNVDRAKAMRRPERLDRIQRCVRRIATVALMTAMVALASSSGFLAPLSHWLGDLRFSAASRPASGQIVLVEIDRRSLNGLGVPARRLCGDLIRALDAMDPAAVALDVDLGTASKESDDAAFEPALREVGGRTILATRRLTGTRRDGAADGRGALPARFRAHAWPALVDVQPDHDGLVRTAPFGAMLAGEPVPSLAALLAGAEWTDWVFRVDWSIDPASFDRISASDVLEGRIDPRRVAGKWVIIGSTGEQSAHLFEVPVHGMVSDLILQATAAETLLQGRTLASTGLPLTALGAELLSILLIAIHCRLRPLVALVVLGLFSGTIEALAILVQARMAVVVDTAAWQLLLLGGAVAAAVPDFHLRRLWLPIIRASNGDSQELAAR